MKSLLIKILVVLVVVAAGTVYFLDSLKTTVRVEVVTRGTALDTVPANVEVVSARTLTVTTLESGYIQETLKVPGQGALEVKAGDILCKLDTSELDFEIARIQSEIDSLNAKKKLGSYRNTELELARKELAHYEKLVERKQFAASELAKRKTEITRLEEIIRTQEIELQRLLTKNESYLDQLTQRKSKMEIEAPADGLLTQMYAFQGDYVYGRNKIAKIISKDVLIELSVSEEDVPGIELKLPLTIKFLGYENRPLTAKVSRISATADPDTKRRKVLAKLDSTPEDMDIVTGMTGEASITKAERTKALIVPRRALIGKEVFVVKNGIIETRKVKVGFEGLQQVEIRDGLEEGELVVVENLSALRAGDKVELAEKI